MTYSPGPNRLTPEARRVLVALHDLSEQRGVPPTLREIAQVTGHLSWSTVSHHVTTLQRLGLVHSYPGQPRGTYLTDAGRADVAVGRRALCDSIWRVLIPKRVFQGSVHANC